MCTPLNVIPLKIVLIKQTVTDTALGNINN